jgi:hypothetical protein
MNTTLMELPGFPQAVAGAAAGSATHPTHVHLADIVFALETQSMASRAYVDRVTGDVHVITEVEQAMLRGEGAGPAPTWMAETLRVARAVAGGSDRFLALPTSGEIDEQSIMERFADGQQADASGKLLVALRSADGGRAFREAVRCQGLVEEWGRHRARAFHEISVEWCRRNGVIFDAGDLVWDAPISMPLDHPSSVSSAQEKAERLQDVPVYTHATWRPQPGKAEEFVTAWNVLGDLFTKLEHPPIEVTLIRSVTDPIEFHSIGSWRSLADAQAVSDDDRAIDALATITSLCIDGMPSIYEVVRHVRPE